MTLKKICQNMNSVKASGWSGITITASGKIPASTTASAGANA